MPNEETTFASKFFIDMRLLMQQSFNLDDVRSICWEHNILYENIPGDTLRTKIQALLDEFRNTSKLPELVAYCRRERPRTTWPEPSIEDLALRAEKIDLVALRKAMDAAFNIEDLKVLCFDIESLLHEDNISGEVSLESVGGSGKLGIIVNLIAHIKRRRQIPYLLKAIRSNRPGLI